MQTYVDEGVTCTIGEGRVIELLAEVFSDDIFLFFSEIPLKVNKLVLIPDAPVLLSKTLDKRN